jgi:hypothetical protein
LNHFVVLLCSFLLPQTSSAVIHIQSLRDSKADAEGASRDVSQQEIDLCRDTPPACPCAGSVTFNHADGALPRPKLRATRNTSPSGIFQCEGRGGVRLASCCFSPLRWYGRSGLCFMVGYLLPMVTTPRLFLSPTAAMIPSRTERPE